MPAVNATVTELFVVPTALLAVGTHGPFVTPQVGGAFPAYQFTINFGPGWPTSGGDALAILVEKSSDGGLTWGPDAQIVYAAVAQAASAVWNVPLGVLNPGPNAIQVLTAVTDLFRVTLTAFKVCSPLITLNVVSA